MTRTTLTHHQRVIAHLKTGTAALDSHRKKVEASLQAHLDAHPVDKVWGTPDAPTTGEERASE